MTSHLGGCYNPDPVLIVPDVWEKLISEYNVISVLDVGCGYGHAMKWFHDRGLKVWGLEGFDPAISGSVMRHRTGWWDFTKSAWNVKLGFDLCWCAEFVEHVEEQYIPNFLPCFKACRHIAMTHAVPGQGGFHHVNEQPAQYWIDRLTSEGFRYDDEASKRFHRPAPYGVNNLLIFHNDI